MSEYKYRFLDEYANFKVRQYKSLAREYPHQKEDFLRKAEAVKRAVFCAHRGEIILDEAMRLIADSYAE